MHLWSAHARAITCVAPVASPFMGDPWATRWYALRPFPGQTRQSGEGDARRRIVRTPLHHSTHSRPCGGQGRGSSGIRHGCSLTVYQPESIEHRNGVSRIEKEICFKRLVVWRNGSRIPTYGLKSADDGTLFRVHPFSLGSILGKRRL